MTEATREPEHVKIYAPAIAPINALTPSQRRVLYAILSEASSAENGMRVAITAGSKRLMCQKHGIGSPQTIANTLSKMAKAGILIRIEIGIYMLNPFLFGKGDWKDIQKLRLGVGGSF